MASEEGNVWTIRDSTFLVSAIDRQENENWSSISELLGKHSLDKDPRWYTATRCHAEYYRLKNLCSPVKRKSTSKNVKIQSNDSSLVATLHDMRVMEIEKQLSHYSIIQRAMDDLQNLLEDGSIDLDEQDIIAEELELYFDAMERNEVYSPPEWLAAQLQSSVTKGKSPSMAASSSRTESDESERMTVDIDDDQLNDNAEHAGDVHSIADGGKATPFCPFSVASNTLVTNSAAVSSTAHTSAETKSVGSAILQVSPRSISCPQPFFNPSSALASAAARQLAVATSSIPPNSSKDFSFADANPTPVVTTVSSVTLSAPTLSKLLEMPPSIPGKLPPLPTVTYNVPYLSEYKEKESSIADEVMSKDKISGKEKSSEKPLLQMDIDKRSASDTDRLEIPALVNLAQALTKDDNNDSTPDTEVLSSASSSLSSSSDNTKESVSDMNSVDSADPSSKIKHDTDKGSNKYELVNSMLENIDADTLNADNDNEFSSSNVSLMECDTKRKKSYKDDSSKSEADIDNMQEDTVISAESDSITEVSSHSLDVSKDNQSSSATQESFDPHFEYKKQDADIDPGDETNCFPTSFMLQAKAFGSVKIDEESALGSNSRKLTNIDETTETGEAFSSSKEQKESASTKPKDSSPKSRSSPQKITRTSPMKKRDSSSPLKKSPTLTRSKCTRSSIQSEEITADEAGSQTVSSKSKTEDEKREVSTDFPVLQNRPMTRSSPDKSRVTRKGRKALQMLPKLIPAPSSYLSKMQKPSETSSSQKAKQDKKGADPVTTDVGDRVDQTEESKPEDKIQTRATSKNSRGGRRGRRGRGRSVRTQQMSERDETEDSEGSKAETLKDIVTEDKTEVRKDLNKEDTDSEIEDVPMELEIDYKKTGADEMSDSKRDDSHESTSTTTLDNNDNNPWSPQSSEQASQVVRIRSPSISSDEEGVGGDDSDDGSIQTTNSNETASSRKHNWQIGMAHNSEEDYKKWKKSISIIWKEISSHKYANVFSQKVTDDVAPGYQEIVHRPMDLMSIKKNIDNGEILTTDDFQKDMMTMFMNAIMYNKEDHDVYKMAVEMQGDVCKLIDDYREVESRVVKGGGTSQVSKVLRCKIVKP